MFKKFLIIIPIILFSVQSIAFSASVGFTTGYFHPFQSEIEINPAYNIGGSLYMKILEFLRFKASYELMRGDSVGEGNYSLQPLTFGGVLALPVKEYFQPYFSFSMGYVRSANFPATADVQNSFLISPGGGILLFQHANYPLFMDINFSYMRFNITYDKLPGKDIYQAIKIGLTFGYNL